MNLNALLEAMTMFSQSISSEPSRHSVRLLQRWLERMQSLFAHLWTRIIVKFTPMPTKAYVSENKLKTSLAQEPRCNSHKHSFKYVYVFGQQIYHA